MGFLRYVEVNPENGKNRGFGYVTFRSSEAVDKCTDFENPIKSVLIIWGHLISQSLGIRRVPIATSLIRITQEP